MSRIAVKRFFAFFLALTMILSSYAYPFPAYAVGETINTASEVYRDHDTVEVIISDPSKVITDQAETITARINSDSDQAGFDLTLTETGPDTKEFRANLILDSATDPGANKIFAMPSNNVFITYAEQTRTIRVIGLYSETANAKIGLGDELGGVLIDRVLNVDPNSPDEVSIEVTSSTDSTGISVIFTETENNSGVFKGSVLVSDPEISDDEQDIIKAALNDYVKFTYLNTFNTFVDVAAKTDGVTADPPSGQAVNGTTVTLSTTAENAEIRYTTDGSNPLLGSQLYSEGNKPVINGRTTIKAFALKDDLAASTVSTFTYNDTPIATLQVFAPDGTTPAQQTNIEVKKILGENDEQFLFSESVDENGQFALYLLSDGQYVVRAFPWHESPYSPSDPVAMDIENGAATFNPDTTQFVLKNPQVKGTVTKPGDPDYVDANQNEYEIRSWPENNQYEGFRPEHMNGNGAYKVSELPNGTVSLKAVSRISGLADSQVETVTIDGATVNLEKNLQLAEPQVTGTVKLPNGTDPYTNGGSIQLFNGNHQYIPTGESQIQSDGTFALAHLTQGIYYIKARPQDGSPYAVSDYAAIEIDGSNAWVSGGPLEIVLEVKTLKTAWIEDSFRSDDNSSVKIYFENISLLENLGNLSVTVDVDGEPISLTNLRVTHNDWSNDAGVVEGNLPDRYLLPYGDKTVTIRYNNAPVVNTTAQSNIMKVMAHTNINPQAVNPTDYKSGVSFTVDVRAFNNEVRTYPWSQGDVIKVYVFDKNNQDCMILDGSFVSQDSNLLTFSTSSLPDNRCNEGERIVDIYANDVHVASGRFDVGITQIDQIIYLEGEDRVRIRGEYLNAFDFSKLNAQILLDGDIKKVTHYTDFRRCHLPDETWYDELELFYDGELLSSANYTLKLFEDGAEVTALPVSGTVTVVPKLTSSDPIITGNAPGESIVINEAGSGWTDDQAVTAYVRFLWSDHGFPYDAQKGLEVNDNQIIFRTVENYGYNLPMEDGRYLLELKDDTGAFLGYSEFYVGSDQSVVAVQVTNPNTSAATGGAVLLQRDDLLRRFAVGRNGMAYISYREFDRGTGVYSLRAVPPSASGFSESAPKTVELFGDNTISPSGESLQYRTPMATVQMAGPSGTPLAEGSVEIRRQTNDWDSEEVFRQDVRSDGTVLIPPLPAGSNYFIKGLPAYESDLVEAQPVYFAVDGDKVMINGAEETTITLELGKAQITGTVKGPQNQTLEEYECDVQISTLEEGFDAPIKTNTRGASFRAGWMPEGHSYRIQIFYRGENGFTASFPQEVTIPENQQEAINLGEIALTNPQISGVVRDGNGPIQGGSLQVLDAQKKYINYRVDIADNGAFRIGGLPEGDYFIEVDAGEDYDRYILYPFSIDEDNACVTPGINDILMQAKAPRITWMGTMKKYDDWYEVEIGNAFLLTNPQNVRYELLDLNDNLKFSGWADHLTNWHEDRANLKMTTKGVESLPFGKYKLNLYIENGNDDILIDNLCPDNTLYLASQAEILPKVVPATEFLNHTFTMDVPERDGIKEYTWISGDTVFARLTHYDDAYQEFNALNVVVNADKSIGFTIPGDVLPLEKWYNVELYKMDGDEKVILAEAGFEVGTTLAKGAWAEQWDDKFAISGDYLNGYTYEGTYVEVYADNVKIAESSHFNNYWGDLQWFLPFRFKTGVSYTYNLYVSGQGLVLQNKAIDVYPLLDSPDPVLEAEGQSVTLQENESLGWSVSDTLKVLIAERGSMDYRMVQGATATDSTLTFQNAEASNSDGSELFPLEPGIYEVLVERGTQCLGYSMIYVSGNGGDDIIQGTVYNYDSATASGGMVYFGNQNFFEQTVVFSNGKFYYHTRYMPDGVYTMKVDAEPADRSAAGNAKIEINFNNGYTTPIELYYSEPCIRGSVKLPDDTIVRSGRVEVKDQDGQFITETDILPEGQFVIVGLEPGTYQLKAFPSEYLAYVASPVAAVNYNGVAMANGGTLTLSEPQVTVHILSPEGGALKWINENDVFVRKLNSDGWWDYDRHMSRGTIYLGNLPEGTYSIHGLSNTYPYGQSPADEFTVTGGTANPDDFTFTLTHPNLTGYVKTPGGQAFSEGYVDIFSGTWDKNVHISHVQLNAAGEFHIGGLPDGEYYLRAAVHDNSEFRNDYTPSNLVKIDLGTDQTVTINLNSKTARYQTMGYLVNNRNYVRARLINAAYVTDQTKLVGQILDMEDNVLYESVSVGFDNRTFDQWLDALDVDIAFAEPLDLQPGTYKLKLSYNEQPLACDNPEAGVMSAVYYALVHPYVVLPGTTVGKIISIDTDRQEGKPLPWDSTADIASVKLYSLTNGLATNLTWNCDVNGLTATLPALAEDRYVLEVCSTDRILAQGEFVVGTPQVKTIVAVTQGDDGVNIIGNNLDAYYEGTFRAQILSGGQVLYETNRFDRAIDFNDALLLDFNNNTLVTGNAYALKIWYNGVEQDLPNGGAFKVVPRLDPDPRYCYTANASGQAITLSLREGVDPTWEDNDGNLRIELFSADQYFDSLKNFNFSADAESITITLPEGIEKGRFWVNISRLDELEEVDCIACSEFHVVDYLQVTGTVKIAGTDTPIPYAEVDIGNFNDGRHVEADANGQYFIYGLKPLDDPNATPEAVVWANTYTIMATAPDGTNYVSEKERQVVVDHDGVTPPENMDLFLQPSVDVSGTISLPASRTAPEGGLMVGILVWSINGTETEDDDIGYWKEIFIPEGLSSADYTLPVGNNRDDYWLRIYPDNTLDYPSQYYSTTGPAFSDADASFLDGTEGDLSDVDVTLTVGKKISGTVTLPAPAGERGVKIDVNAIMHNNTPEKEDDYATGVSLFIEPGVTSLSYSIPVHDNPEGIGYMVMYETKPDMPYEALGVYAADGTSYIRDQYDPVDVRSGSKTDINLTVSVPLAPQFVKSAVSEDGTKVFIKMSKEIKAESVAANSANGFTFTVDGVAYELSSVGVQDNNNLVLTLKDYIVLKGKNLSISYDKTVGDIASYDNKELESFTKTVENKSTREIIVTGIANNGLTKDNVNLTVTATGLDITLKQGENTLETGAGTVTHLFAEGSYTVTILAAGVKDPVTWTFTVDKTAPTITFTSGCVTVDNPAAGVKPVINWGDSVANTRTLTINDESVSVENIPTLRDGDTYTLVATAQDAAGNVGTATVTFTITWDTAQPTIQSNVTDGFIYDISVTPTITLTGGTNAANYTYTAELTRPGVAEKETYTKGGAPIPQLDAEGSYSLKVTATNPSDQNYLRIVTYNFTIDKTAPSTTITGVINDKSYNTQQVVPAIAYTDAAASQQTLLTNATVTLTKNEVPVAYTAGSPITEEGVYVLTAKTKDAFGHDSNVATVSFVIDRTAPTITITGCSNIENNHAGITPVITFSIDCKEDTKTATLNGQAYDFVTSPAIKGNNAFTTYTLLVTARDEAGNLASQQVVFTIRWDESVPTIQSGITNNAILESATPVITLTGGTNQPNYTYTATLTKPNGDTATFTTGQSIGTLTVEGTYTLAVHAVNPSHTDYTSDYTVSFTVDNQAPTAVITDVDDGEIYNTNVTPAISFDDDEVTLDAVLLANATIVLKKDNNVIPYTSGSAITAEGAYELTAKTRDAFGHDSNVASVSFKIDKTAPVIGVAGVANGGLYKTSITPVITFSDAVTSSADLLANATITLDGAGYTPGTAISSEIEHTLVINTTDEAGNAATTKTITFTIDKTAPTITITGCANITNDPDGVTPVIAFSDDEETTRSATLNGLGYDIMNPAAIKAPGSYTLVVTSKDAAGNLGSAKAVFTITWDQTAPVITVNGVANGNWYAAATPSVSLSGGSNSGNYTYSARLLKNGAEQSGWTSGTAINEEGLYRLEVTAVNPSYTDITSTKTVEFNVDKTNPTASITGILAQAYNAPVNPVIVLTDNMASQQLLWKNATISLTKGGAPVTTYKAGDTVSLDGSYVLTATTKDAVNNTATLASIAFSIDRTKPVITLSGVLNGYSYKDQNVILTASANEGTLSVTANGQAVALVNDSYTFEGTAEQVVSYRVVLTATDAAGNTTTQELQFTIDRLPVNILITGVSEGQIINYNPVIGFVTYVGAAAQEGTTAKMDGQVYNLSTILAEGPHTFTATYVAGANTHTKEVRFTIDKTAPAISNINVFKNNNNSAASGAVYVKSGDTLTVKARITEPNGVKAVSFNVGPVAARIPMGFNPASGYYEGTYNVPGGDYADLSVTVEASDKTGNSGHVKSLACVIFIDNTKPVVTRSTSPSLPDGQNGYFKSASMGVTLTSGANEKITYILDGIQYDLVTNTITLTPGEGDHLLIYRATDLAGNVSDDKIYVFKLDSTNPPQVTLSSPATGIVNTELVKIAGSVSGEGGKGTKVVLKRDGAVIGTTSVKPDHSFAFDGVRLLEGANSFELRAVDMAGNESSQVRGLTRTLDSTSPLLTIEKTGDHLYLVTANENISGVTAKFNGVDVAAGSISPVTPNRTYNIETPAEIEGLNTLTVWAKDAAENIGTGSYSSTFIPTSAQNGLQVGDNTSMDIPANTFAGSIQMVVRTVNIDEEIAYKPITAPVQFDFGDAELQEAIVIRLQIGLGLKGVMLMHIDDDGEPGTPVAAIVTTSGAINVATIPLDTPYYLTDTGELVFRTMTFSAYGPVLDNTAPVVTIGTTDYDINKADYEAGTPDGVYLAGSLNEPGSITSVTINGVAMNLGGIAVGDLDQTFNIPLAITDDGTYEVALIASDTAGNAANPVIRTFRVDIHNPTITVADSAALTNRNTVDLNVTTNEMATIKRDATVLTVDDGSFTVTCSLNEGNNSIILTAVDAFGNTATANTVTIQSDTTAPVITINGVSDGDVRGSAANITINVAGGSITTATLDGGPVAGSTVNVAGEGLHTLTVAASDAAGNISTEEISFTIDTSVPTITVSGAVNNGKSGDGKTLTVTASNADVMTITKSVNGGAATPVADAGNDLTENVTLEAVNGQETAYTVRITATRTVGNEVRSASSTFIYTVDKKAPGLTMTAPGETTEGTVTITGTLDEVSDVYLDNVKVIEDQPAGNFSLTNIALGNPLGNYSFEVKAVDAYGNTVTRTVIIKKIEPPVVNPGGGGGGGLPPMGAVLPGATVTGSTIAYNPVVAGGMATSTLTTTDLNKAFTQATADKSGVKTISLNVTEALGVLAYVQEIPTSLFKTGTDKQRIEINTKVASVTIPGNMFTAKDTDKKEAMSVSIGVADTSKLSKEVKDQIGSRPVLELKAMADGKQFSWSNPMAPVTIEMDYTPSAEELKDIDHIVVWYIDGNGKVVEVPNGRYDPATKKVIFTTTHFSKYAVAYVQKTYEDLAGAYAKDIIEALASKGFYKNMVIGAKFNPNRAITRAEFIYLVVAALDLHASFDTNFSDVKTTDYYYEAAGIAKKLGITTGVGNNKLGASMSITRQDMSTILVKALKAANKNYAEGSLTDLKTFKDFDKMVGYARESLATLVKAGVLTGYNKILDPAGTFTMQHAAVVIYKIYKK